MPTSNVIGDVLQLRDAKIAVRTAAATYSAVKDLYGTVTVTLSLSLLNAIREGDGKRLAAYGAVNGGSLTVECASNNLDVIATALGLTYSVSGSTPNQVGTLQIFNKSVPYIGFISGADDDNGLENAMHVFAPKGKITSDSIQIVSLSGGENPEFGTMTLEIELFADDGYNVGATNEVQSVDITGTPTGGTFTLSFGADETTALAFDADAATVQAALEALDNIGAGNVAVTGTNPTLTVTFQGDLAQVKLPLLTGDGALLTGGTSPDVTTSRDTAGSEGDDLIFTIYEDENGTAPLLPPAL